MSVLHIHPEILAHLMNFKAKEAPVSVVALTFPPPTGASVVFIKKVNGSDSEEADAFGKWCFTQPGFCCRNPPAAVAADVQC